MDVAVIGMACRFPDAPTLGHYWRNILDRRVSFRPIGDSRWQHSRLVSESARDADRAYTKLGAYLDDIDAFAALKFAIPPRRAEVMDPQQRLFLETVHHALEDAGLHVRPYDKEKTGVIVGASVSEHKDLVTLRARSEQMLNGEFGAAFAGSDDERAALFGRVAPMRAFTIAGNLLNMAAATVAQAFDLHGPAFAIDAACASSLVAVVQAVQSLRAGRTAADAPAPVMIAGGMYLNLQPDNLIGFARVGAIARDACRPFDAGASGFLMGEGIGAVVLKRRDDAERDGDRIYAVIKGVASNSDGRGEGPMTPRKEGQRALIEAGLADAGVSAKSIEYIECHGTATAVGDRTELLAWHDVIGGEASPAIGSVKANIGHTMSAAGIAGFIRAALGVHHAQPPPQASFQRWHPQLEVLSQHFRIADAATPFTTAARRTTVSAFGFGGTNAFCVLEAAPAATSAVSPTVSPTTAKVRPQLFVLSADTPALLLELVRALEEADVSDVAAVARTLTLERTLDAFAACFVADTAEALARKLALLGAELSAALAATPARLSMLREIAPGVIVGPTRKGTAVIGLFPGQGAQAPDAFSALIARDPGLLRTIEALAPPALVALLFPPAAAREAAAEKLQATAVCQPALAALELGLAGYLAQLGVHLDATIGHSLGEFVAASAAGRLSAEDTLGFVSARGRSMAALSPAPSGMLAVKCDAAGAQALAQRFSLEVANINHPQQSVLGGDKSAIERAHATLKAEGVACTTLAVSHAFHTSFMRDAAPAIARALDALAVLPATPTRLYSCVDGALAPDSGDALRTRWREHAAAPVDFLGALRAAAAAHPGALWLQLGPGRALAQSVLAALPKDEKPLVLSLGVGGAEEEATLLALGALFLHGQPIALERFYEGRRGLMLPPRPLQRERYWVVDKNAGEAPRVGEKKMHTVSSPSRDRATDGMTALFAQQLALLEAQTQIMQMQMRALQGGAAERPGATVTEAAVTAPAAAKVSAPKVAVPTRTTGATVPVATVPLAKVVEVADSANLADLRRVSDTVLDLVAKVSAFPRASLSGEQNLVKDLGFDSLMMVELGSQLRDALAPHGEVAREVWAAGPSIAQVIAALSAPSAPAAATPPVALGDGAAPGTIQRYTTQWREAARESSPRAPRRWALVGEHDLSLLAEALKARGDEVVAADAADASALVFAGATLETVRAELARRFAQRAPEALLFVENAPSGLGAAALSVAQEWPAARVQYVLAEEGAKAADIVAETFAASRAVRLSAAGRAVSCHVPAPASTVAMAPRPWQVGDVVLVTGGASGVGLALARALAKGGARIAVVGRRQENALPATARAALLEMGATYVSADLATSSAADVRALCVRLSREQGPVRGLVHAAGLSHDVRVTRLSADALSRVRACKAPAFIALCQALPDLRFALATSSWAGVFGNVGQFAYAAANAELDLAVRALKSTRPELLALSAQYPPWRDTGMSAGIPATAWPLLAARGVRPLDPQAAIEATLALFGAGAGNWLLGEALPAEAAALETQPAKTPAAQAIADLPFVADHVVKGVARVPLASVLELMVRAVPAALADVVVHEPLTAPGAITRQDNGDALALMRVGSAAPAVTARRVAVPSVSLEEPPSCFWFDTVELSVEAFYERHAFHGPSLRGIERVLHVAETAIEGDVKLGKGTSVDVLAIDASFQLALFWAQLTQGKAALPLGIGEAVWLQPWQGERLRCRLDLSEITEHDMVGTIRYFRVDAHKRPELVGWMRDVRARLLPPAQLGLQAFVRTPSAARASAPDEALPEDSEVPAEHYRFDAMPAYIELRQRLEMAELAGLKNPYFTLHERVTNNTSLIAGREVLNYSSYNYLGLSGHQDVSRAAAEAITRYGTSVSASRVASGEKPLHRELEAAIARFLGCEDAIVMVGGHATNVGTVGHLLGPGDLILHDALAHDSILQGAKLSGAQRRPFPHNDHVALGRMLTMLRPKYKRVLIAIEGTYSMDGDVPNLPAFIALRNAHKCWLMVDEAHSLGVLGGGGRGVGEHFDIDRKDVDLWMGTLSKSLSSCGGYIAGSHALVEYLKYTSPSFVYSVGISPANAAAALASIAVIEREPKRVATLHARSRFFLEQAQAHGLDTGMSRHSAVIPVIVGNSFACIKLGQALLEQGINVNPIIYPAVEDNAARLRFFLTSLHSEEEIAFTVATVARTLAAIRSELGLDAAPTPASAPTPGDATRQETL